MIRSIRPMRSGAPFELLHPAGEVADDGVEADPPETRRRLDLAPRLGDQHDRPPRVQDRPAPSGEGAAEPDVDRAADVRALELGRFARVEQLRPVCNGLEQLC